MLPGPAWTLTKTAHDHDVTQTSIYDGVRQDCIDRGEIPSVDDGVRGLEKASA